MRKYTSIPVTADLSKGVDQKQSFGMDSFELSILETIEPATVQQSFSEPIFYNLLQGKKIMRFKDEQPFEYLPGSTMIVPPNLHMEVNFPDSTILKPTQCLSLTIDRTKIASSLSMLNERFPRIDGRPWKLQMQQYSLMYNEDVSKLILKLYNLARQSNQEARIIAELTLTEMLVLLFQTQNLKESEHPPFGNRSNSTLSYVVNYIKANLEEPLSIEMLAKSAVMSKTSLFRAFKREFNISPLEYINKERISKAKSLWQHYPHLNVSEVGYMVGYTNPNYFARIFKQYTHMSPSRYKELQVVV